MNTTAMKSQMSAFQLKDSVLTLTLLELLKTDVSSISAQLSSLIHRMPDLFRHMPIIIDLKKVQDPAIAIDFHQLKTLLQENGLVPIGIKNGTEIHQKEALSAGLGILNDHSVAPPKEKHPVKENISAEPLSNPSSMESSLPSNAKIITQPVRSGQQIYAKNSDLIILASVSPGAEILACGNIHVYGTLSGRALAGINGNKNAHIFCRSLKAELVSIAGHYWVSEDISSLIAHEKQKEKDYFFHVFLDQAKDHLQIGII